MTYNNTKDNNKTNTRGNLYDPKYKASPYEAVEKKYHHHYHHYNH